MKGYGKDTILTIPDKGNESPETKNSKLYLFNNSQGDLIIQINELSHNRFKRVGNDLIYVQTITLQEALNAEPVIITTLDNRTLNIAIDQIITYYYFNEIYHLIFT